ncbi:MAG: SAM-dependent methyltransferase, partial [Thermoguttaceae bacterium]
MFVTCQVGAEKAVKDELARRWPDFRGAFSRPGFLTFKLPDGFHLPGNFDLDSVFARAWGFSLGKVEETAQSEKTGRQGDKETGRQGDKECVAISLAPCLPLSLSPPLPVSLSPFRSAALARAVWDRFGDRPATRIHAWERDRFEPGEHRFEPSITPAAVEAYEALRRTCPSPQALAGGNHLAQPARIGDWVLDCAVVDPGQWWIGYHRARSVPTRWPGGLMPLALPPDAVSRAWLKMEEALRWSELPIPKRARCAEIGSAPGGASQALLARGLEVLGIDPAEMDPAVLGHPRFRHIRRRAADVPRREFRKIRWLTADMNVAPSYTLDVVESIVMHPEASVRGLLLTLKLLEWTLA